MPPLPWPASVEVVVLVGGGVVVVLDVLVVVVEVVLVVEVVGGGLMVVVVRSAPLVPVGVVFTGMLVSVEPLPHPTTSPPTPIASTARETPTRFRRFKTIRRAPAGAARSTGNR